MSPAHFPELGNAVTAEFLKACRTNNIFSVLFFGTLLWRVKQALGMCRNFDTPSNGSNGSECRVKGGGLKAWLEHYAPKVKRPTAYDYLKVAEAIRCFFERDHGTEWDCPELVLAPAEGLSASRQEKRHRLVEMLGGTSQKYWRDRYRTLKGTNHAPFAAEVTKFTDRLIKHLDSAEEKISGFPYDECERAADFRVVDSARRKLRERTTSFLAFLESGGNPVIQLGPMTRNPKQAA